METVWFRPIRNVERRNGNKVENIETIFEEGNVKWKANLKNIFIEQIDDLRLTDKFLRLIAKNTNLETLKYFIKKADPQEGVEEIEQEPEDIQFNFTKLKVFALELQEFKPS
mmetsp:Transcript_26642/g.23606  ORF Transcript_26642/g.23606 Transcript_26642/m.23606 type:complete len:112 (-) Transcript_26642:599-934(-)